jgi:hypothetical protein
MQPLHKPYAGCFFRISRLVQRQIHCSGSAYRTIAPPSSLKAILLKIVFMQRLTRRFVAAIPVTKHHMLRFDRHPIKWN